MISIFKRFLYCSLFVCITTVLFSQQIVRKKYYHKFQGYEKRYVIDTFSVNKLCLLFSKTTANNSEWEINILDSSLNVTRKIATGINHYFSYAGSFIQQDRIGYLFAKTQNGLRSERISAFATYTYFMYNLKDSTVYAKDFFLNTNMLIKSIYANDTIVFINGIERKSRRRKRQQTFMVSNKVVKKQDTKKAICYSYFESINTADTIYNLVFKRVSKDEQKLCLERLDKNKLAVTTTVFKSKEDKNIYFSSWHKIDSVKTLMAGTYYDATKKYSRMDLLDNFVDTRGVYVSVLKRFEQQNVKFIPFMSIKSFVNKIPRSFVYGKEFITTEHVSIKRNDSLIFVVFDVKMNTMACPINKNALRRNYYLPRDYRYLVVVAYDLDGNLINDYTIENEYGRFNYDIIKGKLFLYSFEEQGKLRYCTRDILAENYDNDVYEYSLAEFNEGKIIKGNIIQFKYWYNNRFLTSGMYYYKKERQNKQFFCITGIPIK